MAECNQTAFPFEAHFSRQVVAQFDGAQMTTDGGAWLLRAVDRRIRLLKRVVACLTDGRNSERIEHELPEMLAQRVYGLALGYEDLNDHEELRRDPLLALLAGKREIEEPLAGKSTLNRLELTPAGDPQGERYHKITYSAGAIDALLVEIFLEAHARPPRQVLLDLDVTDTPLHGEQEARFFHGTPRLHKVGFEPKFGPRVFALASHKPRRRTMPLTGIPAKKALSGKRELAGLSTD